MPLFYISFGILALNRILKFLENKGESVNKINISDIGNNSDSPDLGGYIYIDIPEERKPLFQDLLKGFEEYAKAKGYKVNISIDASVEDKIAFKITIIEHGINTSTKTVKRDLDEYIRRIQNGDDFDDILDADHSIETQKIIMALKNRISFLQQNYQVEKNINSFYKDFFSELKTNAFQHSHPVQQHFNLLQNGNNGALEMQRSYSANNSANIMQGDNHSGIIESGDINIGATYNEKQEIMKKLDALIAALDSNDDELAKAKRKFESVKDEMQDSKEPDKVSIKKWLAGAKTILDSVKVAETVYGHAKDVYEAFGL
ncbi:MAG: hypothetical protein L3K52_14950 [Candidatus Thiothrix sulfatifontis]|nr:MAG: hypothetical protein L3K52_14950 [Candidatus Thiothrix sulfatifontis]